jgi:cation:H+ antiporter
LITGHIFRDSFPQDIAIGNLLGIVSPVHAVTAGSAITMTSLAMFELFFKMGGRVMRAVSWISSVLVAMYLLNTFVRFHHGE